MLNTMRLQALRAAAGRASSRVGLVTSYDPGNYCVRVALQPEGTLTGWLPLCTPWVGNSWGMFCGPSVNEMVEVEFFGDDLESGYVSLRLFNDVDRPLSVPSGEFWLVHQSGAFLKLTNAGQLLAQDKAGSTLTMNGDGTVSAQCSGQAHLAAGSLLVDAPTTINGNTTINGTLTASQKITGGTDIQATGNVADQGGAKTMAGMRTAFNTHKGHGSPGTGNTPDQTM